MEEPPLSPAESWDSNQLDQDQLEEIESELYSQLHYSQVEIITKSPEQKEKDTDNVLRHSTPALAATVSQTSFQRLKTKERLSNSPQFRKREKQKVPSDDVDDSRYLAITKNLTQPRVTVIETPSSSLDTSDSEDSVLFIGETSSNTPQKSPRDFLLSESDSDDLSSDSVVECTDLQLNLSNTASCSSKTAIITNRKELNGAEYSKYVCKSWTREMVQFYEYGGADQDVEAISSSFPSNARWPVSDEDKYGMNVRNPRYFTKKRIRCSNCNQMDHIARHCPDPVRPIRCHMCGKTGHREPRCPTKICLGCGANNGIFSESCQSCQLYLDASCTLCNQKGHRADLCPDLWRRYHLTTTSSLPQRPAANSTFMKPLEEVYCCNCAQRGHLAVHCTKLKNSAYPGVTPVVYDYKDSVTAANNIPSSSFIPTPSEAKTSKICGERCMNYSFSPGEKISEKRIKELAQLIESNVNEVRVVWRKQKKKNRVFVEFQGSGNLAQARDFFKKHLHRSGNLKPNIVADFSTVLYQINYMARDGELKQNFVSLKVDDKSKSEIGQSIKKIEKSSQLSISVNYTKNKCKIFIEKMHGSHEAFRKLKATLINIKRKQEGS